jgi:hypothetical protein
VARPLPVALVQAETLPVQTPISMFSDEPAEGSRRLPVDPAGRLSELHLSGLAGDAAQRDVTMREVGERLDGPRMNAWRQLAGDLKVWLLPGTVFERSSDDGSIYNTAVLLFPEGELAACYRKLFPWRPYERCRPGRRFVVGDCRASAGAGCRSVTTRGSPSSRVT